VCLPEGEKSLICLAVSTQYWRVTDGQTDGQTYGSRGKTSSSRMTFSRCNYQFLFEKTSSEFHRSVWYIQYETMKPSCWCLRQIFKSNFGLLWP